MKTTEQKKEDHGRASKEKKRKRKIVEKKYFQSKVTITRRNETEGNYTSV